MTLCELDKYFRSFLKIEDYPADPSRNGVQIQNANPAEKAITKVAFAVDACEASALAAAEAGAQLLFVHHGLFWGDSCDILTGASYKKIAAFLKNDLALFACHIPLDANIPCGNNYGLAARLGLKNTAPFGEWRGMTIGIRGELDRPCSLDELAARVLNPGERPLGVFPFGKKEIRTVGIVSGGGGGDSRYAVRAGLDAFVTGEIGHEMFHYLKESGMNAVAGGHYQTETVGVSLVREKLEAETRLETVFLDIPTGL